MYHYVLMNVILYLDTNGKDVVPLMHLIFADTVKTCCTTASSEIVGECDKCRSCALKMVLLLCLLAASNVLGIHQLNQLANGACMLFNDPFSFLKLGDNF